MKIPLCGPSYESESLNVDAQRTANWYMENVESQDGASAIAMYPTPGLTPFASVAGPAVRGLYEFNGRTFAVGTNFAEIMADGSSVGYSFLPADSNPVSMAANNANQLIICTAGELWLFPLAPGAIIYAGVPSTITAIQIVDNGDPAVKDYYINTAAIAGYAVGSSLLFAGVTVLPFLNGVSGVILGISGNIVHMQLPRSLTLGFAENIASIVIAANATTNVISYAGTGSGTAWTNPQYVGSTTLSAALHVQALLPPSVSGFIAAGSFGFAIPAGAAITGIKVDFWASVDDDTQLGAYTNQVQLLKAGVPIGTPKGGSGVYYLNAFFNDTYGTGTTDLWGTAFSPADINNAGFGAQISCHVQNADTVPHYAYIQKCEITVYYNTFTGTVTLSQTCLFTQTGQPITLAGLTNNSALNGNTYAQVSASGSSFVINGIPGPAYSGAETGTATGEIINYGPTADTGTVSGTVISYTTNPIQVAVGQGPYSEVDFIDGFFIARISNSQMAQYSAFEDGTTWDPSVVFRVSVYAENNVAMIVDHKEIVFLGQKRSIPYYDTGDLLNPFQPRIDSMLEQGCAAEFSPVRLDNSVFWIGRDERGHGIAWRLQGYTPVRVSNHAIENAWRQYETIDDAIAYPYQDNGHSFWVIWFPSADKTWVYDAATGQWHERFFLNNGVETAHRSRCHSFSFGKHLVGDRSSGTVYWMDISLAFDNVYGSPNNALRSVRRSPHLQKEKQWYFHQYLQVDLQTGTGTTGSATAVSSMTLKDSAGASWAVSADNGGNVSAAAGSGPGQTIVFSDISGNYYQWAVSTTGTLSYVQVDPNGNATPAINLVSPNGSIWQLSVSGGSPVVAQVLAVPPQISLRWSDDSARTWSNYYQFSVGALGEYKKRVIKYALGRSRDRIYEISTNDQAAKFIVDGYVVVQA